MRKADSAISIVFSMLLLVAATWAVRLAWADPSDRSGGAREAVARNRYDSKSWIELGLTAEASGDIALAEKYLLQAAEVDRLFEPRWALANFYARREREDDFWKWFRMAAERSYGDRTALFRLATRSAQQGSDVLRKGLPADGAVLSAYVGYLLKDGRLEEIAPAVTALRGVGGGERAAILAACNRLLDAGRGADARAVWNSLEGGTGGILMNATLRNEPTNEGLDWKIHWRPGVHSTWSSAPPRIRVELSGKQPDSVDLISQQLVVPRAGVYRFRYRYRTLGLAKESGVYWKVEDAEGAKPVYLSSEEGQEGEIHFRVHPGEGRKSAVVKLVLMYSRVPGTVRQEGSIILEGGMEINSDDRPSRAGV